MTRRSAPFEPTTTSLRAWLDSLPAEARMDLCLFMVTTEARSEFANAIDAYVDALQKGGMTHSEIAEMYGWQKANVARRISRHRAVTGTRRPARKKNQAAA